MIRRYNQSQIIKAVLLAFGGVGLCGLGYLFFRYVPAYACWQFGFPLPASVGVGIGAAGLVATWFSAWRTWKARGGLFSYHGSGLYHNLGDETAGAYVTDFYAHRVTGPAYALGQIFMAGPQWLLKAWTLLRSRIPDSPDLEARLEETLARLRAVNKWQGLKDHPDARTEILHLAQMGLMDWSAQKGEPRFKAR